MASTYTHAAAVGPGGVVTVRDPSLPEGRTVRVIVLVEETEQEPESLMRFFGAARGLFATPDEAEAYIRSERDAWER